MSADRWSVCPVCRKEKEREIQEITQQLRDIAKSAGVELDESDKVVKDFIKTIAETRSTLREDFEIGTTLDGVLFLSYSCYCKECGFQREAKAEQIWDLSVRTLKFEFASPLWRTTK